MDTITETLSNEYIQERIADISVIVTMISRFMFVSICIDITITGNNNLRRFIHKFTSFALARADYTKHLP
jgi:hypothetical protein|uniref:Uncharacterized protein n=1 Tax=uncultured haloarchaeon TaxID=160804 RepID=A0A0K1YB64_9EURY|nr:hypothetical protein [uncultured haloarchaeon]